MAVVLECSMALPKKGTRTIHVHGTTYRYFASGWKDSGEDSCQMIIERSEDARQKVSAEYTFSIIEDAYHSVGHSMRRGLDTVPPYVTRQTILIALTRGWTPDEGGGVLKLGNLDDAIDFSELRKAAQDSALK